MELVPGGAGPCPRKGGTRLLGLGTGAPGVRGPADGLGPHSGSVSEEVTWNRPAPQSPAPQGTRGGRVRTDTCSLDQAGEGSRSVFPRHHSLVKGLGGQGHMNPQLLLAFVCTGQEGAGPQRGTGAGYGVSTWELVCVVTVEGTVGVTWRADSACHVSWRCWRPHQHWVSGGGRQSCNFLAGGPLTLVTGEQSLTPKSPVSWSPRLLGECQTPWPS